MKEIFTAKTLEKAKELASEKFGISQDTITYEILEEPKKTFFGRQKGEYVVRATYEPPAPVVEPTVEVVENSVENVPVETNAQNDVPTPVAEPKEIELETTTIEENVKTVENPVESLSAKVETVENVETSEEDKPLPSQDEILEKSKIAQEYVGSILEKMGIDPTSEVTLTENGAVIDFKGDGTGTIIGKRGETLDALQYLSAMICNKGEKDYYRITLDSCGYRAKRKVILEELAKKVSKNVLRTGRSQSLEPMNPYERRIIHATISQIDGVTSRSVGEEPFRKVIISSTNPKKYSNNRNRKGGYNNRNNNNKRGGNNKYRGNGGKKRNFQPRSLDLKTSFEKDYRKPKPEDNLKEGLYGKIEF
jgi:spoIIIJ-associated protein